MNKRLETFCRRVSLEGPFKGHIENAAKDAGVPVRIAWAVYYAWEFADRTGFDWLCVGVPNEHCNEHCDEVMKFLRHFDVEGVVWSVRRNRMSRRESADGGSEMTHEMAKHAIMEHLTVEQLYAFKAVQEDFWEWLEMAAELAVSVYNSKHMAA